LAKGKVGKSFNYVQRAAEAKAAHLAVDEAFSRLKNRNDPKDPATVAWKSAIARFFAATNAAYPPRFWDDYAELKGGNVAGLESAIAFLEADPMFFRSGYLKADLIRFIKRVPLTRAQVKRLRRVAIGVVDKRSTNEFRRYCRLAVKVDGPELREELEKRLQHADPNIARRAKWMMDYLRAGKGGGAG
jgi:hypothetical protein